VFTGLGVTTLSMSGSVLPAVRASLAAHTQADCERLAALALDAPDAVSARQSVAAGVSRTGGGPG
jgi:phosphotransferase system enzyme I (PtsI)